MQTPARMSMHAGYFFETISHGARPVNAKGYPHISAEGHDRVGRAHSTRQDTQRSVMASCVLVFTQ